MDLLPWLPPDKVEHLLGGAFLGASTVGIVQQVAIAPSWFDRVAWGTGIGALAGIAKESLDRAVGSDFDWRDAAFTTGGALIGAVLTASVSDALTVSVTPSRDGVAFACNWRLP